MDEVTKALVMVMEKDTNQSAESTPLILWLILEELVILFVRTEDFF